MFHKFLTTSVVCAFLFCRKMGLVLLTMMCSTHQRTPERLLYMFVFLSFTSHVEVLNVKHHQLFLYTEISAPSCHCTCINKLSAVEPHFRPPCKFSSSGKARGGYLVKNIEWKAFQKKQKLVLKREVVSHQGGQTVTRVAYHKGGFIMVVAHQGGL